MGPDTDIIFKDKKYLDKLSKVPDARPRAGRDLAELTAEFGEARGANPPLDTYWVAAKGRQEISRY